MDTTIQKAQEKQDYVLSDKEALRYYEMQQMAYWDNIHANNYAREEAEIALEKGRKEGMEKSSMDIARRMKARGRPVDEIAEDTGLSMEVIEKIEQLTK